MNRFRKRTNKLDMEHILVGSGDLPMGDGTANNTLPATIATPNLINTSTALGIANGQLGAISDDLDSTVRPVGDFLQAGDTIAEVNKIVLTQGTPKSNQTNTVNLWEVGDLAVKKTSGIRAGSIRSVTTKTCTLGTYSSTYVNTFQAPLDIADYKIYLELDSVKNDRNYGDNDEVAFAIYKTPEYTNAAVAAIITQPLDHLLQNLISELNLYSKLTSVNAGVTISGTKNMIVFGINSAGGTGIAVGTIANGTIIPVMNSNQTLLNYTADLTFVNTVNQWIANGLPAGATIEAIDLSTAGTVANIDSFITMGLDEDKAYAFDNIKFKRTKVTVNLGDAFLISPTPTSLVLTNALEETGSGADWVVEYDNRDRLTIHTMQNHPHGEYFIEGATYIDGNKNYTSTIIDYFDNEETMTLNELTNKQAIVLLECQIVDPTATAAVGFTYATVDVATVASLNTILTPWLTSERVVSNHAIKGDATAAAYFV